MRRQFSKQHGFTLVEVVVYVGLFVVISIMAMNALFQTVKAFNNLRISRDINDSSVTIMERLTRDIKSAVSVDSANSVFNATPGRLTLNTMNASGTPMVIEYYVSSSTLYIKENGVEVGSIMSAGTKVDGLVFRHLITGSTVAIKTELHIYSSRGTVNDTDHFYNTSVLRGSY
jgi:type II secretory pathway pseudopilin PulG